MTLLRWRSELHVSLWCLDNDTVLIETGREWVRVHNLDNVGDVCCIYKNFFRVNAGENDA